MFRPLLWPLMKGVDGSEQELASVLQHATAEQLILLHNRFQTAVTLMALGGVSRDVAAWYVSRGKQAYDAAFAAPDRAPKPTAPIPDFEGVMKRVYRDRFGDEIPLEEPDPETLGLKHEPAWEDELWKVIEVLGVGVPPQQTLAGYTRSELARLNTARQVIVERVYDELAEKIGPRADMYWVEWALGHGKDAIERYLEDPSTAPEMPDDASILADELMAEKWRRYGGGVPTLPIEPDE